MCIVKKDVYAMKVSAFLLKYVWGQQEWTKGNGYAPVPVRSFS
jgi:hypothetical protein